MNNIGRFCVDVRALRRFSTAASALFFYILLPRALFAMSGDAVQPMSDYGGALAGYMTRMLLALLLLAAAGYAAAKFLPKRFRSGARGDLRMLGAINLGRDMVYLLQAGPNVIALFVGKNGATLLCRWGLDEWGDYEAVSGGGPHGDLTARGSG
jgi:hypothetical protein